MDNDIQLVLDALKQYVGVMTSPILKRIDDIAEEVNALRVRDNMSEVDNRIALSLAALPIPKDGTNGRDGIDAPPVDYVRIIELVKAELPSPKDGAPGRDGKDADLDVVREFAKQFVSDAVYQIPKPINGKDGEPGKDGLVGRDGKDADLDAVREFVQQVVVAAVDKIPEPINGKDGIPGRDGLPGVPGRDGLAKDGAPGKDGIDGFGLNDFDAVLLDDGRTICLTFTGTDLQKQFDIKVAWPLDRGTFKHDEVYEKGDGVTFEGSWWIAQQDTHARPGTSPEWRLATKRGRDGRDAELTPQKSNDEPVKLK